MYKNIYTYQEAEKKCTLIYSDGGNWDIFAENRNGHWVLLSIATPERGAESTYFGSVQHLKNLVLDGYKKIEFLTSAGRTLCGIA